MYVAKLYAAKLFTSKKVVARSLLDYRFDSASSVLVETDVDFASDPLFWVGSERMHEFC